MNVCIQFIGGMIHRGANFTKNSKFTYSINEKQIYNEMKKKEHEQKKRF